MAGPGLTCSPWVNGSHRGHETLSIQDAYVSLCLYGYPHSLQKP